MSKRIYVLALLFICLLLPFLSFSEELPIPTYSNSIIISLEHSPYDTNEVNYIKNNYNFGLYAWLSFSRTTLTPVLDWHSDLGSAAEGIQSFKDQVNGLIAKAQELNVGIHIVLTSGLARQIQVYKDAKEEDIRNAQWFNDNNLCSDTQILDPEPFNKYIFGTFSRYARKMRENLEVKAKAALAFLKQKIDENPDTLIVLSGWGEAEFSDRRINHSVFLQDWFCDYSPFAILEFRDWIRHKGMYADITGKYESEGYSQGGVRYQGLDGLDNFNTDFGTNFSTWELKYFNWSLDDTWDQNPQDDTNDDPNIIPYSSYSQGNMMSALGFDEILGGFDPPREMGYPEGYESHSDFWDLWNLFRETMVHHFIRDMAIWTSEAGIPADKWYSHQIPGDYLGGANPDSSYKNARYYTSASPLWAADNQPYGSMGATIYDIKLPPEIIFWEFIRVTTLCVPAISSRSPNWAIMEYDAEVYPTGLGVEQSSVEFILNQYLQVYNGNPHFLNFWRWIDLNGTGPSQIKGMNKETALGQFIEKIRDKARGSVDAVFDPPKVIGFSGEYTGQAAETKATTANSALLQVTGKIWDGESWEWTDWGDFLRFEIHRSTFPDFEPGPSTFLATTTNFSYEDTTITSGNAYFYKIQAVNKNLTAGPASNEVKIIPSDTDVSVLNVDKRSLVFNTDEVQVSTVQNVSITNLGPEGTEINWEASFNQEWLEVSPLSGVGEGTISIDVSANELSVGIYNGEVTVTDPHAFNSPLTIAVQLTVHGSKIHLPSTSLDFGQKKSGAEFTSTLTVENKGVSTLTISSIANNSGESLSRIQLNGAFSIVSFPSSIASGESGQIEVKFSPTEKTTYSTTFKISSNDADEAETNFSVTGEGVRAASIVLSKTSLSFGAEVGGPKSDLVEIIISNAGDLALSWQALTSQNWINISQVSGSDDTLIEISVDHSTLSAGDYTGEVGFIDSEASNSPQTILIALTVYSIQQDEPPFGSFDSPDEGSVTSGSIPVTGWALDDIGVTKVEIKRNATDLDPAGAIGLDGLIYIGDAVFVRGARPDIAPIHPAYPQNDRAGWGYMMLSNALPNQGNGSFTLYAFAYDESGNMFDLGQKNIVCDNENHVKPFGAIETPTQGGPASGSSFWNWGWVLTPPPNQIPTDGSTINVFVNSVNLGHPVYNLYREDVDLQFPDYKNSSGAFGYFIFDTTTYTNGVHNIHWVATDDDGNIDGIGSRYFEIQNVEGSVASSLSNVGIDIPVDPHKKLGIRIGKNFKINGKKADQEKNIIRQQEESLEMTVEQLSHIRLELQGINNTDIIGWGKDKFSPLPIGSTLDSKNGIFYWIPGPGFLGRHTLHFSATDGTYRSRPIRVVVNITAKKYPLIKSQKKLKR